MGLSGSLAGIVPAEVTWAQAKVVWLLGVDMERAAVAQGSGFIWDDPNQGARKNNLAALEVWRGSFDLVTEGGGLGEFMDRSNWDALRIQVYGAASDLDSMGEVSDAFYKRLGALPGDLAKQSGVVVGVIASTAGDVVGGAAGSLLGGLGWTGAAVLGVLGLALFFAARKGAV
jgi:hypothetical protein